MGRTRPTLAASLARQAAQLRSELIALSPGDDRQLALFGRAATVSQWAAAVSEDVGHLDEIVEIGVQVVNAAGRNNRNLFPVAANLLDTMTFTAWCYLDRFDYQLDLHDLDEANRYAADALELAGDDHIPEAIAIRARTVLARVADRRFELNGARTLLDDAVRLLEYSLTLQPDAIAMAALATCLRHRADPSDPKAALNYLNRARGLLHALIDPNAGPPTIPIYPLLRAQWSAELGLVHLTISRIFGSPDDLRWARELTRAAVSIWPSAVAMLAVAEVVPTESAYWRALRHSERNKWASLQAACQLTRLAVGTETGAAGNAAKPAQFALDLLQEVIERQIGDANKALWLPRLAEITAIAAPALAARGNVSAAASYVELARTCILQEHFPDEEHELFELGMAGHQDFSAPIRHTLDILRSPHSSTQSRARARDELSWYVDRVRRLPGFSTFRTSPGVGQIGAMVDAPVIYLVPGKPAGVALVIRPNGEPPVSVPLPGCPIDPLPLAVRRFRTAVFSAGLPAGARRTAIDAISIWAWDAIYEPLREVLAGCSYAHVIGASYLGLVPCHAARTRSSTGWRYAVEEIELRYIPSARALAATQHRQLPEKEPRFLIIPQPAGTGLNLDGARSEVNEVSTYFTSPAVLAQQEINAYGIRRAIGGVGWLHAACHGLADAKDPLASGLILADGERFTLRDLFNANQGHLLVAVLSACQTNVPDVRLPDEATSLAVGLLLGGCRSVIASAWQVPDSATSALMQLFYRRWRRDGDEVSYALRQAQLAFATGTAAGEEWKNEWAEPYFWAGFSYLGP